VASQKNGYTGYHVQQIDTGSNMKNVVSILPQFTLPFVLLALLAGPTRADVAVRVHMIDARTGKPIPKKPVHMWVLDAPNQFRPGHLEEKTDSSGVANFTVSDPLPEYLEIRVGMGGYWEECSSPRQREYTAKEVLDSGISIKGTCSPPGLPKADLTFEPKPGEVYLFAAHLNLWEWIRYCGRRGGCGD
jgi:hypothetical protein